MADYGPVVGTVRALTVWYRSTAESSWRRLNSGEYWVNDVTGVVRLSFVPPMRSESYITQEQRS